MGLYDYILLFIVAACLAAAVIFIIKRKKAGKNFCCGSCDSCGLNCRKKQTEEKTNEK